MAGELAAFVETEVAKLGAPTFAEELLRLTVLYGDKAIDHCHLYFDSNEIMVQIIR